MLNLDTHILIHALADSLTAQEDELLRKDPWGVSDIVLWELAKLSELGRIDMDLNHPETESALRDIHVWPIDLEIAKMSTPIGLQ